MIEFFGERIREVKIVWVKKENILKLGDIDVETTSVWGAERMVRV